MVYFFIGGLIITVFLLAFFIIDLVYSWRIYNNNNISSGEAIFLIIMNIFGLLLVLSMVGMFMFQTFRYLRKEGVPTAPPMPKDFGIDFDMNGKHKHNKGKEGCSTGCTSPCPTTSCYSPPTCAM